MDNDRILNERYRIQSELGKGSFGVTYLAKDINQPNQPQCVIKQLQLGTLVGLDKEEAKRRFEKEAETLNKLGHHSQIPQLWDSFTEDHQLYLVQEYINGKDLSKIITDGKGWSEGQVIGLLYDVLEILKFIQQQNPPIIHRDINPKNLIQRESDRRIVLIDFGAVKAIIDTSEDETELTLPFGTGDYRAEEQKNGKPCLQSDIYGLGKTALFALTGNPPRRLNYLQNGCVIWPEEIEVSNSLKQIIDKMVQRESSDRYATAAEALEELAPLHKIGETVDGYTLKAIWEGEEFSQTYLAYQNDSPDHPHIVKRIIHSTSEGTESATFFEAEEKVSSEEDRNSRKKLIKVVSKNQDVYLITKQVTISQAGRGKKDTKDKIKKNIPTFSHVQKPAIILLILGLLSFCSYIFIYKVAKIPDCFEHVPNVPAPKVLKQNWFNYGHSSTFVTIRDSIEKK